MLPPPLIVRVMSASEQASLLDEFVVCLSKNVVVCPTVSLPGLVRSLKDKCSHPEFPERFKYARFL